MAGITYTDYFLPGSIDHTGATDVRQAIGDWIAANVPDGADAAHHSRIRPYDASSVYLLSSEAAVNVFSGFQLRGRRHITIDGGGSWSYWPTVTGTDGVADAASYAAFDPATDWVPGARIDLGTSGNNTRSAAFLQEECTDVRVTGWDMDGGNPNTGTTSQWDDTYERSCAWYPRNGCAAVSFDNNRVDNWNGWAVFLTRDGVTLNVVPDGIAVHHNYIRGAEMGVAFVSGKHADVDYNIIVDTSWYPFDIEQEADADVVSDVRFHHNIVDRFAWYTPATCWTLSMAQAGDGTACVTDRITFEQNYIAQGPATSPTAYAVLGGSVANPTVLTTDPYTGVSVGDYVWVSGTDGGTPSPAGMHLVTGTPDDTHIALDFDATVGCAAGGTVALASNGDQPGQGGLAIGCYAANPKNDIVIRNNWSDDTATLAAGWRRSMLFDYVTNLEVAGNRQIVGYPQSGFITDDDPSGLHTLAPNTTTPAPAAPGPIVFQHLGDAELDTEGDPVTTSVLVVPVAVTYGHQIVVGLTFNADSTGDETCEDTLGNVYTLVEHTFHPGHGETTALFVANVGTVGCPTITATHATARRRAIIAAEFVTVGVLSVAGGGDHFVSSPVTWVDGKRIPANGIAIGVVSANVVGAAITAGADSGAPATQIVVEHQLVQEAGGRGIAILYASAGATPVATFSGTAAVSAVDTTVTAGGVFAPAVVPVTWLQEFELKVDGTDVSALVWDWGSLRLDDSYTAHAALSVTIRQLFGDSAPPRAMADVSLRDLVTGDLLFSGFLAGDVTQTVVDPTFIDTDIRAVDYGALLDTWVLNRDGYSVDMTGGGTYPLAGDMIGAALLRSTRSLFTDLAVTAVPYAVSAIWEWGLDQYLATRTWDAFTTTASVISDILAESMSYEGTGGIDGYVQRNPVCKHFPGRGLVLTAPDTAWRGQAPIDLTAAAGYRPAGYRWKRDDGAAASGIVATDRDPTPTDSSMIVIGDTSATNGHVVIRETVTPPWNLAADDGAYVAAWYLSAPSPVFVEITAQAPYNLLVGQEITVEAPGFAGLTGAIQSVSTTLLPAFDMEPRAWPLRLDGGYHLDDGLHLDDTETRVIPRRLRSHTITISGTPRTFVGAIRSGTTGV